MRVCAWLIDLIHRRESCPTGMISGWVQKVTSHNGITQCYLLWLQPERNADTNDMPFWNLIFAPSFLYFCPNQARKVAGAVRIVIRKPIVLVTLHTEPFWRRYKRRLPKFRIFLMKNSSPSTKSHWFLKLEINLKKRNGSPIIESVISCLRVSVLSFYTGRWGYMRRSGDLCRWGWLFPHYQPVNRVRFFLYLFQRVFLHLEHVFFH